jgi:hypothetical protein
MRMDEGQSIGVTRASEGEKDWIYVVPIYSK